MSRRVAVIDFGTAKIVTAVAEQMNDERLLIHGSGIAIYDGFNEDGNWNTPRQMVRRVHASIREAEEASGKKIDSVYVGVPGAFINVRTATVSVESEGEDASLLTERLMDRAADELNIPAAQQLVLHRAPAWYRVDGGEKAFTPSGTCERLEGMVSFVLAAECFIEDVSEMLGVLGITILGFVASTYGADMLVLPTDERDAGAVVLDCGFMNTDLSVVKGDAITYHAVLPFGGMDLMVGLVDELELTQRDAERIKRDCGFRDDEYERDSDFRVAGAGAQAPQRVVRRQDANLVIRETAKRGLELMRRVLDSDAQPFLDGKPNVLLIGGGLAKMRGAAGFVSAELGYDTRIGMLNATELNSPEYISVMGLLDSVLMAIGDEAPEENAPEEPEQPEPPVRKRGLFGKKQDQ